MPHSGLNSYISKLGKMLQVERHKSSGFFEFLVEKFRTPQRSNIRLHFSTRAERHSILARSTKYLFCITDVSSLGLNFVEALLTSARATDYVVDVVVHRCRRHRRLEVVSTVSTISIRSSTVSARQLQADTLF